MNNITLKISEVIGIAPSELVGFYVKGDHNKKPELLINQLNFQESLDYSIVLNKISVAKRLGLWTLEEVVVPSGWSNFPIL